MRRRGGYRRDDFYKESLNDFVGKDVKIVGRHPWQGETGKATEVQTTPAGPGLRIKLSNGMECFVFHPSILEEV